VTATIFDGSVIVLAPGESIVYVEIPWLDTDPPVAEQMARAHLEQRVRECNGRVLDEKRITNWSHYMGCQRHAIVQIVAVPA
jgi:hypothetical protein